MEKRKNLNFPTELVIFRVYSLAQNSTMFNKISVYERIMNAKRCEVLRKGNLEESSQQACPSFHRLLGGDSHWDEA